MLSIVIGALNEEAHLHQAASTVIGAARKAQISPFELIIVNDGSTNGTAKVIETLEREFPFVSSITHPKNEGVGKSFLDAVAVAKYDRVAIFPGDNSASAYTIRNLLANAHRADVVLTYTLNTENRTLPRHCLSLLYFLIYTLTFNVHLKYVHGLPVYPTHRLRKLSLYSRGYSLFSEINIKLLRQGATFCEVDGYMNPNTGKSSALKVKNLIDVVMTFLHLVYTVYFREKVVYGKRPTRVIPTA